MMTKFMKAMMATVTGALLLVTPALAWDTKALNKQVDETNFLVNKGCSGTLVAKDLVLTAAHCILNQYDTVEKEVVDDDGKVKKEKFRIALPGTVSQQFYTGPSVVQTNSYVYKIVRTDRANDLALLRVETPPKGTVAELACTELARGDAVYAVGNSYAILYSTVTKGIVSSVHRSYRDLEIVGALGDTTDSGDHGLTQHSAVIAGGNSGGALYTEDGKLTGVNVRGAATGFSFAVPLSDVKEFLDKDVENKCG